MVLVDWMMCAVCDACICAVAAWVYIRESNSTANVQSPIITKMRGGHGSNKQGWSLWADKSKFHFCLGDNTDHQCTKATASSVSSPGLEFNRWYMFDEL